MRLFKKLRGVKLSYDQQGYIFFLCRNFRAQDEEVRYKIRSLCRAVIIDSCGEYSQEYFDALFEFLTKDVTAVAVALKYNTSESQLYRWRRRFYEGYFAKK